MIIIFFMRTKLFLFYIQSWMQTWICLALTMAAIGPLLYGIHYMSPYHEHHQISKKGGLFKIQNCFWYMYGALLQQGKQWHLQIHRVQHWPDFIHSSHDCIDIICLSLGGMYLPKSDSGRIIVGTWWLVVLVVVTTYCGNLVAFLTFPKMEISVNTVSQLVNQKDFTWSIRENTFLEGFLKVNENMMI